MKKTLIALACAAILATMLPGCTNTNNPATPTPTLRPSLSPTQAPMVSPTANPTVDITPTAGVSPSAAVRAEPIEGFKEGEKVEVDKLPEKVTAAVKAEYADAKITGATYATYMDTQTYLITLSGANVDKVYVKGDGTIIPAAAASTAKP